MGYSDRHIFSLMVDGSSTGDKGALAATTNRLVVHKIGAYILDATTGAGTIDIDKRTSGTDTADGVGQLTVSSSQAAGDTLYEDKGSSPVVLPIGYAAVIAVDDAFDAFAVVTIEYSLLDEKISDSAAVAA